jgi:signal peptidase I
VPPLPVHTIVLRTRGADRVVEILQTVLTGLILAFIMRAFLIEPFIIPTGSMAEALLGAHATQTCPACGWQYDFAPARGAGAAGGPAWPDDTSCPNCHHRLQTAAGPVLAKAGDRVLVHKWPYALGIAPQRWDVIVFRDPANPDQHYIKRLVGLPGETVEIVDGDVFIDGRIARKPPYAQAALWYVVFDQRHVANPLADAGRALRWRLQDPQGDTVAGWSGLDSREIRYTGMDDVPRTIGFNADTNREYLMDFYAYNRAASGVFVGDVRVVAELTPSGGSGWVRWEIVRSGYRFAAEVHRSGQVRLLMSPPAAIGGERVVGTGRVAELAADRPVVLEFAHVDWRVTLRVNGAEVVATRDEDYAPQLEVLRGQRRLYPVGIHVTAAGLQFALRGLRIDRDVHYTHSPYTQRAYEAHPFTLRSKEYFVLGDNSPDSHDSREWTEVGHHLPMDYRPGTVLAEQIVGQAAFVYLPGLLPCDTTGRWLVPDLGRVRFVH